MRAYGLPRESELKHPDVADIVLYARAGYIGHLPGKSDDYHRYSCGESKRRLRRYWKRQARKNNILAIVDSNHS